jgi:ribonuclease P protein component
MSSEKPVGRFGRPQKLKSRKQIQKLFTGGNSLFVFPVKIAWMVSDPLQHETGLSKIQAGVSVSKRNFKKAVDRNRIKRLLREAYRLHKKELAEQFELKSSGLSLFLIYVDKTLPTFDELKQKVALALKLLKEKTGQLP